MNEIYPRWVAAHGVMIVTPVYWYQAPGGLKSMMDRLVCADGGNPDPTSTAGKDPKLAKQLELKGWTYPRHLAGRAFAVVVHGDPKAWTLCAARWSIGSPTCISSRPAAAPCSTGTSGTTSLMRPATKRWIVMRGCTGEVRNAARSLANEIALIRKGRREPDERLDDPRPK